MDETAYVKSLSKELTLLRPKWGNSAKHRPEGSSDAYWSIAFAAEKRTKHAAFIW